MILLQDQFTTFPIFLANELLNLASPFAQKLVADL